MRLAALFVSLATAVSAAIIGDVRAAIANDQFSAAEKQIADYRKAQGTTPESLAAMSWLGRGAVARKRWDAAEKYARETHRLSLEHLKAGALDREEHLPIALGAAIEVQALAMAGRGERDQGVEFLRRELKTHYATSIRARIQKNIHLLSLEGKPAPALDVRQYLGPKPLPLTALRSKAVLVFLWAHWCGDCKFQGPILAKLWKEFAPKGLALVGPTQHYGYVAGGEEATRAVELKYIDQVRREHYASLLDMPAPVSEENFKAWGSSTSPTIALIDRKGIVRMYHPGRMTEEELRPRIEEALR